MVQFPIHPNTVGTGTSLLVELNEESERTEVRMLIPHFANVDAFLDQRARLVGFVILNRKWRS